MIFTTSRCVKIAELRFKPDGSDRYSAILDDFDETPRIALAITGQRLLNAGTVIDPYMDFNVGKDYADMRHLLSFPYVTLTDQSTGAPVRDWKGRDVKRDFGIDQFSGGHAEAREKYADALSGKPVRLSLDLKDADGCVYAVAPQNLKAALAEKNYLACGSLSELESRTKVGPDFRASRGYYYLNGASREAHLVFRRAAYPHHCVCVRRGEPSVLYHVLRAGWSNNAGTNPLDLAIDLKAAGFSDALLLDNGGDVVMWCRRNGADGVPDPNGPCAVIPSSLGRESWAGLIVYHTPSGETIEDSGQQLAHNTTDPSLEMDLSLRLGIIGGVSL